MTPKEKALKLIDYFFPLVKTRKQQKQCALILVSEIIKENLRYDYIPFEGSRSSYFLEVEKEILEL